MGVVLAQEEEPLPEAPPQLPTDPLPEPEPLPTAEPEDTPAIPPEPMDDSVLTIQTDEAPFQPTPSGRIFTNKPAFEWEVIEQASDYELEIYRGTSLVATIPYDNSICTEGICRAIPDASLAFNSAFTWRTRAYVNEEWQEWCASISFNVASTSAKTSKPSGTISQPVPTYIWTRTANTPKYQIEVYKGTKRLFTLSPIESVCNGNTCQTAPNKVLTTGSYKWRVRAYANGKYTAWSAYRSFKVVSATPKPTSPTGTVYVDKPTYQWSRTANATKYQVELYQGSKKLLTASPSSKSCSGNVCQTTPSRVLSQGSYKWRVRAYISGKWKSWSAYKTFTAVNPVPSTQSPDGVIYGFQPTYAWSSVNGASQYHYQVYQDGALLYEGECPETSVSPDFNLAHAAFQWRVRSQTAAGWNAFSSLKDFSVSRTIPEPFSPQGYAYSRQPTFSWGEVVGASLYRYEIYHHDDLLATDEVDSPSFISQTQLDFGEYRWRVQALLNDEWLDYSDLTDFILADPIPQNQFPSGTLYTLSPDFSWSSVDGAQQYQLQVFEEGQAEPVLDTAVENNSYFTTLPPHSYQWQVRAKAGETWHDYSQPSDFTLIDPLPTPQYPTGIIYSQNPSFSWNAVSGASLYRYEIYRDSTIYAQGTSELTSLNLPSSMAFADYQWRVQAQIGVGWLDFSELVDFTIAVPVPEPQSPEGYIYQQQPTFSWSSVADANSYNYVVYQGDTKIFDQSLEATSHTPDVILEYGVYTWQVRSKINDDWSAFSTPMPFEVVNPIPELIGPQHYIYITDPTLTWHAVGGVDAYSIEVYEGETLVLSNDEVGQPSIPLSNLNFTEHKWRVRAWVEGGWGDYSEWMAFTSVDPVPETQSPEGLIYSGRPTYAWAVVSGIENYRYQVFQGETEIFTGEVSAISEKPDFLLADGAYRWRVQSKLGDDYGPYSEWLEFTIINPVPLPLAPAGTILKHKPTYSWEPVSGASQYRLEVFLEGNPVFDLTTSNTSVTPSTTLDLETYTWQVSAYAGGEWHAPSSPLTFTVDEPVIERVSISSSGEKGNGVSSNPSISANGRYVAFQSNATNLVEDDINEKRDIFVHDRHTDEIIIISMDSNGMQGNDRSSNPSISGDGLFVTFESDASNLVADDTNEMADIFVHDIQTGTTTRVSLDSNGTQANGTSLSPSISADGRFVAFESYASNLVADDSNENADIFVHDRQTGETQRVSVPNNLSLGEDGDSSNPTISADGRYVAFESVASNLVADDTNDETDIFVHDMQTGETRLVSLDSNGTQGNGPSGSPSISADGRYVAFQSFASNLVSGDTKNMYDIFRRDMLEGSTIRVSVHSNGREGNGHSYRPSISADGRYVAFESLANDLVAGDTNGKSDIFFRDTDTQYPSTSRISLDSNGIQGDGNSYRASVSPDGRYVAFESDANLLVEGGTTRPSQIFVHYKRPR